MMTALGWRSVRGGLGLDRGSAPAPGALAVWVAAWLLLTAAAAEADATLKVRVQDGQSFREIAQKHLGDPDLWTEILRANGLRSITDVRPGPSSSSRPNEISAANRALRRALERLQRATEQVRGCSRPPRSRMGSRLYERAVAKRKAGEWAEAEHLAGEAALAARDGAAGRRREARHDWPRRGSATAPAGSRAGRRATWSGATGR